MIVKTYGLYDEKAKNYVRTFVSENDETAERACSYIVREKGFDPIAGRDMTVHHLFDFDSTNGAIVDNTVKFVCSLGSKYQDFLAEVQMEVKKDDE